MHSRSIRKWSVGGCVHCTDAVSWSILCAYCSPLHCDYSRCRSLVYCETGSIQDRSLLLHRRAFARLFFDFSLTEPHCCFSGRSDSLRSFSGPVLYGDPVFTESEIELVAVPWVENNSLQFDEVHDAEMDLNDLHLSQIASGEVNSSSGFVAAVTGESLRNISTIAYIPCALGLWLGRLLSLPLLTCFALGRLFNLFAYVVVTAIAILYIPKWKSLIATVALLPYAVYLASNYSYDPWVTGFLLLAVALVLRGVVEAG